MFYLKKLVLLWVILLSSLNVLIEIPEGVNFMRMFCKLTDIQKMETHFQEKD